MVILKKYNQARREPARGEPGGGFLPGKAGAFPGPLLAAREERQPFRRIKERAAQGGNRMMREGNLTEKEEGNHHGRE